MGGLAGRKNEVIMKSVKEIVENHSPRWPCFSLCRTCVNLASIIEAIVTRWEVFSFDGAVGFLVEDRLSAADPVG